MHFAAHYIYYYYTIQSIKLFQTKNVTKYYKVKHSSNL